MSSIRTSCVLCNELGKFYCNGCKNIFCQNHATQYQESFNEQLDWLTVDYNDLETKLNDRLLARIQDHPSMRIIDRWEDEAVARIRQSASDTRQAFIDTVKKNDENVATRLRSLITKLSEASKRQLNFDERQLKQWATALQHLRQKIESVSTITVHVEDDKPVIVSITNTQADFRFEDNDVEPSYSRGLVPLRPSTVPPPPPPSPRLPRNDRFEWSSGDVQIQENGQIVVHNPSTIDASVRGLLRYQSGTHQLLFRIERMYENHWLFFGIVSTRATHHHQSYLMPSAYG